MFMGILQMERKVAEVTQKRNAERKSKGKLCTAVKDRDKGTLTRKQQPMLDISRRDVSRSKRMQELMRQVLSILRQVHFSVYARTYLFLLCGLFLNSLHRTFLDE